MTEIFVRRVSLEIQDLKEGIFMERVLSPTCMHRRAMTLAVFQENCVVPMTGWSSMAPPWQSCRRYS